MHTFGNSCTCTITACYKQSLFCYTLNFYNGSVWYYLSAYFKSHSMHPQASTVCFQLRKNARVLQCLLEITINFTIKLCIVRGYLAEQLLEKTNFHPKLSQCKHAGVNFHFSKGNFLRTDCEVLINNYYKCRAITRVHKRDWLAL